MDNYRPIGHVQQARKREFYLTNTEFKSSIFYTKFIDMIKNSFILGISCKESSIYKAFIVHDLSETRLIRVILSMI